MNEINGTAREEEEVEDCGTLARRSSVAVIMAVCGGLALPGFRMLTLSGAGGHFR